MTAKAKKILLALAVLFLVVLGILLAWRVSVVNAGIPSDGVRYYLPGEQVPMSLGKEDEFATTLTVIEAAIVEGPSELPFEYEDRQLTYDENTQAKYVLMRFRLTNQGAEVMDSVLPRMRLVEKSWSNGFRPPDAYELNPTMGKWQLQPGESKEAVLMLPAYNIQFGFNTSNWENFGSQGLCLAIDVFPEQKRVILGESMVDPEDFSMPEEGGAQ